MKGRIEVTDKAYLTIPFHVSDITFADFCDFQIWEYKYLESVGALPKYEDDDQDDQDDEDPDPGKPDPPKVKDPAESIRLLTKALSFIYGSGVYDIPLSEGNRIQDLINSGFNYKPFAKADEISLFGLYAHFLNMVTAYKTDPSAAKDVFNLDLAGERFVLESKKAARILLGAALTTGEVIETLEYQRRAGVAIRQNRATEGAIDFNLGLTELAILIRKPGEQLPGSRSDFKAWIQERRQLFAEVRLNVIFDLRFFLLNSLTNYEVTRLLNISGKDATGSRERARK